MAVEHEEEIPLTGGWVTSGVVRVGDTVRRPPGPNAALVHRLLGHLEEIGFESAPRFLGLDEQEREVLSFIEGYVPSDCRTIAWADNQLEAVTRLLRRFHDATAGSDLAANADVICHNDFGPWNLVWHDELPVAIIDFDSAAIGTRLDDVGYAIWKHLNIGLIEMTPREQGRRLQLMTSAYGLPAGEDVLRAIERAQERMRRMIEAVPGSIARDEAVSQNDRERDWMRTNRRLLLG